jgi:hypothetical protein
MSTSSSLDLAATKPLATLRLEELDKVLSGYAAQARQAATKLSGDPEPSLKQLQKLISALSSRADRWVNPPAAYVWTAKKFTMFSKATTEDEAHDLEMY